MFYYVAQALMASLLSGSTPLLCLRTQLGFIHCDHSLYMPLRIAFVLFVSPSPPL